MCVPHLSPLFVCQTRELSRLRRQPARHHGDHRSLQPANRNQQLGHGQRPGSGLQYDTFRYINETQSNRNWLDEPPLTDISDVNVALTTQLQKNICLKNVSLLPFMHSLIHPFDRHTKAQTEDMTPALLTCLTAKRLKRADKIEKSPSLKKTSPSKVNTRATRDSLVRSD